MIVTNYGGVKGINYRPLKFQTTAGVWVADGIYKFTDEKSKTHIKLKGVEHTPIKLKGV